MDDMDYLIHEIVERIVCNMANAGLEFDEISKYVLIQDTLSRLGDLDASVWNDVISARDEYRSQVKQWEDDKEFHCKNCRGRFTRKELYYFYCHEYNSSIPMNAELDGMRCAACFDKAENEFVNQYGRVCVICGDFFLVNRQYTERYLCKEHDTIKNRNMIARVGSNNSRTRSLGLASDLTVVEWFEIIKKYNNKCAYCGDEWHDLEHFIPVIKGGGTTKDNVVPSCRTCNIKKKFKIVDFPTDKRRIT